MNFAAGLLQGVGDAKNWTEANKLRRRELGVLEAQAGIGGGNASPAPERKGVGVIGDGQSIGDRAKHAYQRFVGSGLSDHHAAGLVGNFMQESGQDINPAAVGDNGNAYGAGQWNGPRREAYWAYADGRQKPRDDFDTQIDFLMHEGQTSEKAAWDKIMATTTAEDAARVASEAFWRPGVPHLENRQRFAGQVYSAYRQPPSAGSPPVAANAPAEEPTNGAKLWGWAKKSIGQGKGA